MIDLIECYHILNYNVQLPYSTAMLLLGHLHTLGVSPLTAQLVGYSKDGLLEMIWDENEVDKIESTQNTFDPSVDLH